MTILLNHALLVDLDPPRVEPGALRIDSGIITERGRSLTAHDGEETIDCGGAVVLPGLVNGHTHLYAALAVGLPPPAKAPHNFLEILQFVWWRLDRAHDETSIAQSALMGGLEALRCGTTTLIDHHASPQCIAGSLDLIEQALESIGLRGVLCYETTDRNGRAGRDAGLEENRRYLRKCRDASNARFAALIGAHASFTLDDDTLDALAELATAFDCGAHVHVAEDPCDEQLTQTRYATRLIDRLEQRGLGRSSSIFAHGAHLAPDDVARMNKLGLTVAHNPRSNMHNAVGYAPVNSFSCPVVLGTDGIGVDMLAEAQSAWWIARHEHAGLSPLRVLDMLAASARRASASLGITLGKLQVGAAADVVITDYIPPTPLTTDNLVGHLLFGMSSRYVRSVLIDGQWRLRDRVVLGIDEVAARAHARETARALWQRMAEVPFP